MSFLRVWRISRPRFWIYTFGPYLVGLLAGAQSPWSFTSMGAVALGLFFLLPANLLIYGVNDIYDFETDKLNPKKAGYEDLVPPELRPQLWLWMAGFCLPFLAVAAWLPSAVAVPMALFLFLSLQYSAGPIRAKGRPGWDTAFNGLYFMPGVCGYLVGAAPGTLNYGLLASAWFWTMAMHAYSAVPDIESDERAGLKTIATELGGQGTLGFCLALYWASALGAVSLLGAVAMALGAVYGGLMLVSLRQFQAWGGRGVMAIYRWFPWVNTVAGGLLFLALLARKPWF